MQITDLGPANTRLCSLITSVADADLGRPTPRSTEYTMGDLLITLQGSRSPRRRGGQGGRRGREHGTVGRRGQAGH